MPRLAAAVGLLAIVLSGTAAVAQVPFPMPVQQGAVTYITGGIGDDEIAAMKESMGAYNLLISDSEKDGSYTADVDVTIRDGHGRIVLSAKNTGPLLYIKLPPGDYTLDALYHGVENTKDVTITPKRSTELNLVWPTVGG